MTESRCCADVIVLDSIAANTGDWAIWMLREHPQIHSQGVRWHPPLGQLRPFGRKSWLDMCIKQMKVDFEIRSWLEKNHKQRPQFTWHPKYSDLHSDRSNISDEASQIWSSIGHYQKFSHVSSRMNLKAHAETNPCLRWEPQRQDLRCVSNFNLVSRYYNHEPPNSEAMSPWIQILTLTGLFLMIFLFVHLIAPSSTFCLSSLFSSYGKRPR